MGSKSLEVIFPRILLHIILILTLLQLSHAQNSPQDFLDAHNTARAAVGVANLEWSDEVAAYAEQYANTRINDCALVLSGGRPYGENIARQNDDSLTAAEAVQAWVNESVDYDYNSNTCATGKHCSSYIQVVWRNTLRLGCARVVCATGGTFITCNYDPSGNVVGEKPF